MPRFLQLPGREVARCLPLLLSGAILAGAGLGAAIPGAAAAEKDAQKPAAHAGKSPAPGKQLNPADADTSASVPSANGPNNPMVASVEGHPIYLSDLGRAEKALPANLRNMPFESLYPVLLDRLVDHQALVMLALRRDLEDNPEVKQQIQDATNRVLEAALLGIDVAPKVTEAAIKARYDQQYANQPATEQVHALHILVSSKEEAEKLIAELNKGADFTTLAEQYSKDPDGKKGGDLGFFSREQVWPGFADVAFSLNPGQVASEPVHNEFGWHIIKVMERRLVAPPSLADVHDQIRQQLLGEAVEKEVALARGQLTIQEWNLDGSPLHATAQNAADRQKQQ